MHRGSIGTSKTWVLRLAEGPPWIIRAADREAVVLARELAKVLCLRKGNPPGLVVTLATRSVSAEFPRYSCDPRRSEGGLLLTLPRVSGSRRDLLHQMVRVAGVLLAQAWRHGAALVHGALLDRRGKAVLLSGPSGVGKSTAACRLRPPWHALCDDVTLLVRGQSGDFWAHPWPTWSRLFDGEHNLSWPVERARRLQAIFFLDRSLRDAIEPVAVSPATVTLLARLYESSWDLLRGAAPTQWRNLQRHLFSWSSDLAHAVPCWRLKVTLRNRFWLVMESALKMS